MRQSNIVTTTASSDYELLDSGDGEKLERFGSVVLSRPDPQALWKKNLPDTEWKKADFEFSRTEAGGEWKSRKGKELQKWDINFGGLKLGIKPTAFKHTGLFPEQSANWDWMRHAITSSGRSNVNVLNLFAYTGGATLACAQVGAKVVHIDGSKSAVQWARDNAELSGLSEKPIRWILEDARVFVGREVKRGNKYDAIIMDPPAFGHGANKEIWKIEEHFMSLIEECIQLLSDEPLFFVVNGYSAGYSAIAYENALEGLVKKYGGKVEIGELTLEETGSKRLLPCGIFARWSRQK